MLHLLVHGIQDYTRERSAGLLMSAVSAKTGPGDSGKVWSDRLEGISAPSLVVMTACGTGRGPARWGDPGVSNLAGILFERGADTVILPYANLAYEATTRLSGSFHRFLRKGHGPAEALRRARVELARDENFRDPFYHSLLHVRGLPHRPIFERR